MTLVILYKLLAIALTVALGYAAGRMRWLGDEREGADPARTLAAAAFYIFIPALMFRTTARLDLSTLPWHTLAAFFVPVMAMMLGVYAWQRRRRHDKAATPAVRAFALTFGNTVQIGIPMAAALFGEAGLGLHITIVSLHALVLLTAATALVELDLAHARARDAGGGTPLWPLLRSTLRQTIIHPVMLPVLAGMAWHLVGVPLPAMVDEVLQLLASAVVPLCLVLMGLSLAYYGLAGSVRSALAITLSKLLALPALVLVVAHWGFGLTGVPLAVVVVCAALPVGANPLIFAQRYAVLEAETTTATVLSTLGFALTAPLWLLLLEQLGP